MGSTQRVPVPPSSSDSAALTARFWAQTDETAPPTLIMATADVCKVRPTADSPWPQAEGVPACQLHHLLTLVFLPLAARRCVR